MYEGAVAVVIKFAVSGEREGIVEYVNKSGEFVVRFGMTRFRLVEIFYVCQTVVADVVLIWGVGYIQVHRWIDEQGLEFGLEGEAVVGAVAAGLQGCGAVASGLYLRGWRFGVRDTLAGKGVIDVGKYIFSFLLCINYPYGRKRVCRPRRRCFC